MLLIATFLVLLEIIDNTKCTNPRSVNLALKTVLAFDNKDSVTIDNVQDFLSKLKNLVNNNGQITLKTPQRRHFDPSTINSVKFTDFVKQLIEVLKKYDNDDLEDVFAVINDEIGKFHYKGCKFYELVSDDNLRKFVADKLSLVKEKPAKVIRRKLDEIIEVIDDSKFDSKQSDLLDYINSLYTKDNGLEFGRILQNFQMYKTKSKRANTDLRKLVRNSIRSVIFDHYSNLNVNTRRDLKARLNTVFWNEKNKKYDVYRKEWTLGPRKIDKKQNKKYKEQKSDTAPIENKEFIDVLIKDLETLHKQLKNKSTYTKKDRKRKSDANEINQAVKKKSKQKPDSNEPDEKEISVTNENSENADKFGEFPASYEPFKSNAAYNKKGENYENSVSESDVFENKGSKNRYHTDNINNNDDASHHDDGLSTETEVTVKSKRHRKYTTTLAVNSNDRDLPSEEFKHGRTKRKHKKKAGKLSEIVTLYSEDVTWKSPQKYIKVEKGTTVESNDKMQTLWEEKLPKTNTRSTKTPTNVKTNPRHDQNQKQDKHSSKFTETDSDYSTQIDVLKTKNKDFEFKPGREQKDTESYESYKLKSLAPYEHIGLKFILRAQKQYPDNPKLRSRDSAKHIEEKISIPKLFIQVESTEKSINNTIQRHKEDEVQESSEDEISASEKQTLVKAPTKNKHEVKHKKINTTFTPSQHESESLGETDWPVEKEKGKFSKRLTKRKQPQVVQKYFKESSVSGEDKIKYVQTQRTLEESTKEEYTNPKRQKTVKSFPRNYETQRFGMTGMSVEQNTNDVLKIISTNGTSEENLSRAKLRQESKKVESSVEELAYKSEKSDKALLEKADVNSSDEAVDSKNLKMKVSQERRNETPSYTSTPSEEGISIENSSDGKPQDKIKNNDNNKGGSSMKSSDSLENTETTADSNDIELFRSTRNNVSNIPKSKKNTSVFIRKNFNKYRRSNLKDVQNTKEAVTKAVDASNNTTVTAKSTSTAFANLNVTKIKYRSLHIWEDTTTIANADLLDIKTILNNKTPKMSLNLDTAKPVPEVTTSRKAIKSHPETFVVNNTTNFDTTTRVTSTIELTEPSQIKNQQKDAPENAIKTKTEKPNTNMINKSNGNNENITSNELNIENELESFEDEKKDSSDTPIISRTVDDMMVNPSDKYGIPPEVTPQNGTKMNIHTNSEVFNEINGE